jgi:predicted double-glycine peptidase
MANINKLVLEAVQLVFPDVRQATEYTCGASVVQAVLFYYGIESREDKISEKTKTDKTGTNVNDIINTLNSYNLKTDARSMFVQDLKNYIDKSIPVIIAIQAWSKNKKIDYAKTYDEGHYVVVIGYDENNIIFEDPSILNNKAYLSYKELEERWHDKTNKKEKLEHFGIAVYGKAPNFNINKFKHID